MFKVGDKVRIKKLLHRTVKGLKIGDEGIVIMVERSGNNFYCVLDIEKPGIYQGGFWFEELELVKKEIKLYGIVKFCQSISK